MSHFGPIWPYLDAKFDIQDGYLYSSLKTHYKTRVVSDEPWWDTHFAKFNKSSTTPHSFDYNLVGKQWWCLNAFIIGLEIDSWWVRILAGFYLNIPLWKVLTRIVPITGVMFLVAIFCEIVDGSVRMIVRLTDLRTSLDIDVTHIYYKFETDYNLCHEHGISFLCIFSPVIILFEDIEGNLSMC